MKCMLCDKKAEGRGFCSTHYRQYMVPKTIVRKKRVIVERKCMLCDERHSARGFCTKHYYQYLTPFRLTMVKENTYVRKYSERCLIDPSGTRWLLNPDYTHLLSVDGDELARIQPEISKEYVRKYTDFTNQGIKTTQLIWFANITNYPEVYGLQDDWISCQEVVGQ